jgi:hypothetical protein
MQAPLSLRGRDRAYRARRIAQRCDAGAASRALARMRWMRPIPQKSDLTPFLKVLVGLALHHEEDQRLPRGGGDRQPVGATGGLRVLLGVRAVVDTRWWWNAGHLEDQGAAVLKEAVEQGVGLHRASSRAQLPGPRSNTASLRAQDKVYDSCTTSSPNKDRRSAAPGGAKPGRHIPAQRRMAATLCRHFPGWRAQFPKTDPIESCRLATKPAHGSRAAPRWGPNAPRCRPYAGA